MNVAERGKVPKAGKGAAVVYPDHRESMGVVLDNGRLLSLKIGAGKFINQSA